ncbi:ankyrin repeat domain-containing protein [Trinickia dinghuensis]|nr:ankyrin repeat domain-containing protein [Trinickia dinghuensis]
MVAVSSKIEFSERFYEPVVDEHTSPYEHHGRPVVPVHFAEGAHGTLTPAGFHRFPDVSAYIGSREHGKVTSQYRVGIRKLAKFLREKSEPASAETAIRNLEEFEQRRKAGDFSTTLGVVDGDGKLAFDSILRDVENDSIPLDTRIDTIAELARGLVVCGPGAGSNLVMTAQTLRLNAGGVDSALRAKWESMFDQCVTAYCRNVHKLDRGYEGSEVHYVNEYRNALADEYHVAPRKDEFRIPHIDEERVRRCSAAIAHKMTPYEVIRELADDCFESIRDMLRGKLSPEEYEGPLDEGQAYKVHQLYTQELEAVHEKNYGGIGAAIVVNEYHGPGGPDVYTVIDSKALLFRQIARNLRAAEAIQPFKFREMARDSDAPDSVLKTAHREAFYIKTRVPNGPPQYRPVRVADVETNELRRIPRLVLEAIENTSDPAQLAQFDAETVFNALIAHHSRAQLLDALASPTVRRYREAVPSGEDMLLERVVGRVVTTCTTAQLRAAFKRAIENDDSALAHALLPYVQAYDCRDRANNTPLHWAAQHGMSELVGKLVHEFRGNPEVLVSENDQWRIPLMLAVQSGHMDTVRALLNAPLARNLPMTGRSQLAAIDNSGRNAVYLAARAGHARIVKYLADFGAPFDVADNKGQTPLMSAALLGHAETIDVLLTLRYERISPRHREPLKIGVRLDLQNMDGNTALILAASATPSRVDALIQAGADPSIENYQQTTALHMAAMQGKLEAVQALVRYPHDLERPAMNGYTPLSLAARGGHAHVIEFLLAAGANPEGIPHPEREATALWIAVQGEHEEAIVALAKGGANVNLRSPSSRWTPVYWASSCDKPGVLRALLTGGADPKKSVRGETPLMIAAEKSPRSIEPLLLVGAEIDARNPDGRSALMRAAANGVTDSIATLVTYRVNVNQRDAEGWTALMYAVEAGKGAAVRALLAAGADPANSSRAGETAFSLAEQLRSGAIMRQLTRALG